MNKFAWIGAVGVVALLGACGKSEGSGPLPKEQLPARVADIYCNGLAGCCHDGGFAFDVATCKSTLRARFERSLAEMGPNVDYDAEAAGQCLDAAAARSTCGALEDDAPACERVFRGRLALGAECESSDECREEAGQRAACNSPDGGGPNVCTLVSGDSSERGALGDSCVGTCAEDYICGYAPSPDPVPGGVPEPVETRYCYRDDGLHCDPESLTCQPLKQVGAACQSYDDCAGEAFCDFMTSTCTAPRANGQDCDGDAQCQSGSCADGSDIPEPGMGPIGVCIDRRMVTAEQCMIDFDEDVSEETEPAPPAGP